MRLSYNGKSLTAPEWAEIVGLSKNAIERRMKKSNDTYKILFTEKNYKGGKTGIKYIFYQESTRKYVLQIKRKYLGSFDTLEEAIQRKEDYLKNNDT